MISKFIDLGAAIIPAHSLGHISIGKHIGLYDNLLSDLNWACEWSKYQLVTPWEAQYSFDDAVHFNVDIRYGVIAKISAGNGYHGLLWNSVSVNSSLLDALKDRDDYYIQEDTVYFRKTPGVSLTSNIEDLDIQQIAFASISYINVFSEYELQRSGVWIE